MSEPLVTDEEIHHAASLHARTCTYDYCGALSTCGIELARRIIALTRRRLAERIRAATMKSPYGVEEYEYAEGMTEAARVVESDGD